MCGASRLKQMQGIGTYMFRIDEQSVVDATKTGNAARYVNHSCEACAAAAESCMLMRNAAQLRVAYH